MNSKNKKKGLKVSSSLDGYIGANELIQWLHKNDLLAVKELLLKAQMTLKDLIDSHNNEIEKLVKELDMPILKRKLFIQAVTKLQLESANDGRSIISGVSSIAPAFATDDPLIVMIGIGEYDTGLDNLPGVTKDYENIIDTFVKIWNYKLLIQLSDNAIIYSNNINSIKTETSNGNKTFKLRWTSNDIDLFIEQARKHVVSNYHNGLIFAISSHGESGKVIIDSELNSYSLHSIFHMFSPQWGALLETYQETPQQGNQLFNIPKIFLVDACRGSTSNKVVSITAKTDNNSNNSSTNNDKNGANATDKVVPGLSQSETNTIGMQDGKEKEKKEREMKTEAENEKEKEHKQGTDEEKDKQIVTRSSAAPATSARRASHAKSKLTGPIVSRQTNDVFRLKGITKLQAHELAAQEANFCKLYANVDGFSVGDGSKNGGLFLRNAFKTFKDKKFISTHSWQEIILKIREYTKREATIFGIFNFTQLVETESTLERPIKFIVHINSNSSSNDTVSTMNIVQNNNDIEEKNEANNGWYIEDIFGINDEADLDFELAMLTITNLLENNDIAVLMENEYNTQDRRKLIDSLVNNNSTTTDSDKLFSENGFVMVKKDGGEYEFNKLWEKVFVTLIKLASYNEKEEQNTDIYDRKPVIEDYLYFENDWLMTLIDLKPKCPECNKSTNQDWYLREIKTNEDNLESFKCNNCKQLGYDSYYFYCRNKNCSYCVCKSCCHSLKLYQNKKTKHADSNPNAYDIKDETDETDITHLTYNTDSNKTKDKKAFPDKFDYSGWLEIRKNNKKDFEKQFCVLSNNFLLVGKTPTTTKLEQIFPLQETQTKTIDDRTFIIVSTNDKNKNKYQFRARNSKECIDWTSKISRAAKLKIKDIYRLSIILYLYYTVIHLYIVNLVLNCNLLYMM